MESCTCSNRLQYGKGILNKYRITGEPKQQLTIVWNKLYVLQRRGGKNVSQRIEKLKEKNMYEEMVKFQWPLLVGSSHLN